MSYCFCSLKPARAPLWLLFPLSLKGYSFFFLVPLTSAKHSVEVGSTRNSKNFLLKTQIYRGIPLAPQIIWLGRRPITLRIMQLELVYNVITLSCCFQTVLHFSPQSNKVPVVQPSHAVHPLTPLITYSDEHFAPGSHSGHHPQDANNKQGRDGTNTSEYE